MSNKDINMSLQKIEEDLSSLRNEIRHYEALRRQDMKDATDEREEIYKASAWTFLILGCRQLWQVFRRYVLRKRGD